DRRRKLRLGYGADRPGARETAQEIGADQPRAAGLLLIESVSTCFRKVARESKCGPEPGLGRALLDESRAAIERERPWVRDHQEAYEAGMTRTLGGVVNECGADAVAHRTGFDEQILEFSVLPAAPPAGEAEGVAVGVEGDAHAARGDRCGIDAEDVGVCIEVPYVL